MADSSKKIWSVIRSSSGDIAEVWFLRKRPGDMRANARLIAAAPELLDACHVALKAMEMDCTGQFADEIQMLIDAISKAGGEP